MNPIKFECPHCHEIIAGDESLYGQRGGLQRLLGYGTITVLAADDTSPEVDLVGISTPTRVKELIRTEYRAARQREGVHPTEFMQSP
jgi:hypothetical protein